MYLLVDIHDPSATMTVTEPSGDAHSFDIWPEDGRALVEYQESLIGRGRVTTLGPPDHVYRFLLEHDALTRYMDRYSRDGVSLCQRQREYSL